MYVFNISINHIITYNFIVKLPSVITTDTFWFSKNFYKIFFAIKDIKTEKDEVIVRYTVNPLLMSEGTDEALRNKYAVDSIPKGIRRAKLVQVRQEFVTDKDN